MTRLLCAIPGVIILSGCALKGDVRRVETQLAHFREVTARTDSVRAVTLSRILDEIDGLQTAVLDSLEVQRRSLLDFQGTFRSQMTDVQRQLVMIQELTGQSQARLAQLRREIEDRQRRPLPVPPGDSSLGVVGPEEGGPGAEELFSLGREQLRRGSPATARAAFQKLLEDYPEHELAADAQYQIGETFGVEMPDSAVTAYGLVVDRYPGSNRAPAALYRIALVYEQTGDEANARLHYERVIAGYPQSEEAQLARTKINP